jgi:sulfite reductase (NADPH) flavoprotein alpha-component
MDVAFSRDGKQKVYVQHKLQQQSKEIFDLLENGAHFYVCGDMKKMAKDVHSTLIEIVQKQGGRSQDLAIEYVNALQKNNRYQTDVY